MLGCLFVIQTMYSIRERGEVERERREGGKGGRERGRVGWDGEREGAGERGTEREKERGEGEGGKVRETQRTGRPSKKFKRNRPA